MKPWSAPRALIGFGALVFAAGLGAWLTLPKDNRLAVGAVVVAISAIALGLILDALRDRIPALRTPAMRLHAIHETGRALRHEIGIVDASSPVRDRPALEGRVREFEVAFWSALREYVPHRLGPARGSQTQLGDAVDDFTWQVSRLSVLDDRLRLLVELLRDTTVVTDR